MASALDLTATMVSALITKNMQTTSTANKTQETKSELKAR